MRAVLILLFCAGLAVAAPDRNAATVSGNGVEKIESLPGIMRMTLRLEAKADTLDKALEDMAKQTADVKTRLTALNPVDGKITVIGPLMSGAAGTEQERMMAMVQRRFGGNANAAAKPGKKEVTVQTTLMADWKLAGTDTIALLKESQKISDAVQAAAPRPAPAEKKDGGNEEEEEQAMMRANMGERQIKPNEPTFAYVGTVDKAALAKARKAAFQKARDSAQATADAAGAKLGPLMSLHSGVNSTNDGDNGGFSYYAMRQMQQMMGVADATPQELEGMSMSLNKLVFTVTVSASFALDVP